MTPNDAGEISVFQKKCVIMHTRHCVFCFDMSMRRTHYSEFSFNPEPVAKARRGTCDPHIILSG